MTRSITTQTESSIFTTPRWPSSRRTHSLSSASSSASSASSDSLPPSPATPLPRYTAGGGGVPFSWESIPGIPKNTQMILPTDRKLAGNHLPLPPPAAAKPGRKGNYENATRRGMEKDPFFTALVECSKGVGGGGTAAEVAEEAAAVDKDVFGGSWKSGGRSLLMGSCKSASDIAESLVLLPRRGRIQTRTRRIGYEMMKK